MATSSEGQRRDPRRAAQEAAEALRQLNHRLDTIESTSDAYDIVGALAVCLERMPQALSGVEGWLIRQDRAGRLLRTDHGPVDLSVGRVRQAFGFAREWAAVAAAELRQAHIDLADVFGPVDAKGEGR